ncbi:MAG: selenocysteine-specific translation elongation factor [Blastocatellia bacterium]|nr:selenocysteine-specific translation elongation factor [Blastocatellia bacterium]MBK6425614.1 selenocysteine-specific translation elongation factor [Blastocatellia bacterium]
MKHVIVGTAGHIDHGKTSLVRALTGIDADRLKEEKQRGITIDIGFANLLLDDIEIGFVDVPGHERFVKNMLAGAHGIDLVVLVIAADEAVMPQTREHFDICRLLGVRAGVIALTKSDLVDAELLGLARAEVEDFVAGSFLDGAPIVPVSSTTGAGLDELRTVLHDLSQRVPDRASDRPFRLPIDRAFTIRGFGTVLTGTLISGEVAVGDALEVLPAGLKVKVRGLQVHGVTTERATTGQRTAVNLQGVELDDVERGQVLAPVGRFRSTSMLDVKVRVLEGASRPLEHRARVRFHHGTVEAIARVVLLGRDAIEPGGEALAQIRLETPVLALPGDRFILRSYSPQTTIGGGVILDAAAVKHRQSDTDAAAWLERLEAGDARERVAQWLVKAGVRALSLPELVAVSGLTDDEAMSHTSALVASGRLRAVGDAPLRFVDADVASKFEAATLESVKAFHKREPIAPGLPLEELRSSLFALSPIEVFRAVTTGLVESGKLVRDRDVVRLASRAGSMSAQDEAEKASFETLVREAGLEALSHAEIAAKTGLVEAKAKKFADLLVREGRVVRLGDLLFHVESLDNLKSKVRDRRSVDPRLDIAAFRDLSGGLSRKYSIPLLEWLDRERVTRRVGDGREIL